MRMSPGPFDAVLLDAFGTLLRLEPPAPRLRALLAADGHAHPEDAVARALADEIRFYRRHHDRGRDAASLAALRRECAAVIARGLGLDVPPPDRLAALLVDSLRFALMPEAVAALDALRAAGLALAVVSNWDCSLPRVLAGLGIADRFAAIATSAETGAAKPDPRIFHHVLGRLGVRPGRALHCGDHPEHDCAGARAAGVRAVIVDREGVRAGASYCPRIRGLGELVGLAAGP